MATGPTTTPATTPAASTTIPTTGSTVGQQTGSESSLSNWVGPYVTDMLGKGQALSNQAYEAYTGPLTAGESNLQNQAFTGLANLTVPTSNMGAFTPGTFNTAAANTYMNPYLQGSLDPQIAEARRQAEISNMQNKAKLTQAGGYGGSRQAIMESENQRNLLQNLAGITGAGYNRAYDNAQAQFNAEQNRQQTAQNAANEYGLAALQKQADLGAIERTIEGEDIAARKKQFEEERDDPYKKVTYQSSLLQGLPVGTTSYSYSQPSDLSNILNTAGGAQKLYDFLFSDAPTTPTTPTKP
jgi:hypothetical protein